MNPVDNNPGVRPQRSESDRDSGPARAVDSAPLTSPGPADITERLTEGESVTLTRTAAELLQLEESLQALPSVDQARVEAIRTAIDNGSYRVDTGRIVDSLLQSEAELR
jgi:negative regulator of flagellin synthesis FlgM